MSVCESHGRYEAADGECPQCRRERQRAEAVDRLLGVTTEPAVRVEVPAVEVAPVPEPLPVEATLVLVEPKPSPEPEPEPEPTVEPVSVEVAPPAPSAEEAARIHDEIRKLTADLDPAPVITPSFAEPVDATADATLALAEVAASDPVVADPSDDAAVLERFNRTLAEAGPSGAAPRVVEPEMSAERIQELIDKNANVVGLLGFPGAGKTWFLNRLKFELFTSRDDRHEAIPPHAAQWDNVGRTNGVSEHFFRSTRHDAPSSFYVIDIPGERFISLAEGRFLGRERELLALKACKALIIVVPADEVLLGERASALFSRPGGNDAPSDQERQARALAADNPRLERFTAHIAQLNVVLSLLSHGVEVGKIAAMTSEDLIRHLDSDAYKPSSKPVFVALSKADVIEAQAVASQAEGDGASGSVLDLLYAGAPADIEALQEFDRDPEEIVDRYRPALASAVGAFRWSKFDFVTAFRGHGDGGAAGTVVDYTLGRRGVAAVLRWMEWARASDTDLTEADWRAIGAARALRRFRNQGRLRKVRRGDQFR
ncbi:hypothetical protein [Brevundimonas sp.]|jgi:hypothetical protein|uniref:hypothetical protein n=1 Tax=Brevundimonas sp. TaxID=1871086 RepID=UPI003783461B